MSNLENPQICQVCSNPGVIFYSINRLNRSVYRCSSCDFKWTCPPLHYDAEEPDTYYEAPPYSRCIASDEIKAKTHLKNISKAIDLQSAPTNKLLEVGCSNGSLLKLMESSGYIVEGLEISKAELDECRRKELKVHPETIENFQTSKQFGIILSAHVVEHLRDINQYFNSTSELLAPNGLNIFLTPNGKSLLFRLFKQFWAPATPDEHNLFLTPKSISILAEKHGFDVVSVTNTGRYFSSIRGIIAEINKTRPPKPSRERSIVNTNHGIPNTQKNTRNKREAAFKIIKYLEQPFLVPLHYVLTRFGLSDELLCVLKKR